MFKRGMIIETLEYGECGDVSSIPTLIAEVEQRHDYTPSYQYACEVRLKWRAKQGIENDCRTYDSQPRRDMLNDEKLTKDNFNKSCTFIAGMKLDVKGIRKLARFAKRFHSLEQMETFFTATISLKKLVKT